MNDSFIDTCKLPLEEDDTLLDLDKIASRVEELSGEVDAYRQSIIRHIKARLELLGRKRIADLEDASIQRLLHIKEELDEEFRQRFRIQSQPAVRISADNHRYRNFLCGQ